MTEVEILITPNHIKAAASRAALCIRKLDFEALFLNFSKDLEEAIRELIKGAPYEYILNRIQELKLIPEPIGAWEYSAEPILRAIRGVYWKKPNLSVCCYEDSHLNLLSTQFAEKIALLIFRQCSTGKIDLEDWRSLLNSWLESKTEASDKEAHFLVEVAKDYEKGLCISGFEGKHIKTHLHEAGYRVDIKHMYLPYHFTPLEILIREMERKASTSSTVSSERMKQLIEHHARFVRDYVTLSENYDKAYINWMQSKVPWLKPSEA